MHRDLAEWSRGYAIEVRHFADKLVIANPGGLFGITVDRLGVEGVTSARNGQLLTICQYVRTKEDGARVVEALATGIPTVNASLEAAGMPPAQWIDTAIRFTAILSRHATLSRPQQPLVHTASEVAVWEALATGPINLTQIQAKTGLGESNVHRVLRELRGRKLVELIGGRGQPSSYRRVARE